MRAKNDYKRQAPPSFLWALLGGGKGAGGVKNTSIYSFHFPEGGESPAVFNSFHSPEGGKSSAVINCLLVCLFVSRIRCSAANRAL